jgi:hypothetical protein
VLAGGEIKRGNEDEGVGLEVACFSHQSSGSREVRSGSKDSLRGGICCFHQIIDIAITKPEEKEGASGIPLLTLWTPISLRTRSVQVGLFNISRSRCIGLGRLGIMYNKQIVSTVQVLRVLFLMDTLIVESHEVS